MGGRPIGPRDPGPDGGGGGGVTGLAGWASSGVVTDCGLTPASCLTGAIMSLAMLPGGASPEWYAETFSSGADWLPLTPGYVCCKFSAPARVDGANP